MLNKARVEQNLSWKQIAEVTNISITTLEDINNGQDPNSRDLPLLFTALNIQPKPIKARP
jgi:transcriptional regulator with XRE-family HTH domain